MTGTRHHSSFTTVHAGDLAWLAGGFALAVAVSALIDARPARAQGSGGFSTTITSPSRAQPPTPRRAAPPSTAAAEPSIRGTIPTAGADPGDVDPTADPGSDQSDGGRTARVGQRPARQDGDLEPAEPAAVQDGIVEVGEPEAPEDGSDPTRIDARDPDDVAVFESPPAGFDPLLFDAEVEPILDRRPARLFQFEPYDPKGIRVGSFVLFPEAEIGATWLSNVFRTSSPRTDTVYDVRPAARLVSNWRTHALEFRASGLASRFAEFSSENEKAYLLEMRGRIDISKRTNVEALANREVTQESRSSATASRSASTPAEVATSRMAATLNHRFNRLAIQLRGSVVETDYGAVEDAGGTILTNDDRDVRTTEEAIRLRWEFKPTLFGFIEYALNQRDYKTASLSDDLRRDSSGDRTRVGVSFGNTSQRLRGELSVGYGRQKPDDRRLQEIEGVVIDANVAYRMSALTSFLLTARSDVAETSTAGSGGALSRQIGIEARHALQRHLIATAGLAYAVQDYAGIDLDEREWRTSLGLEYFVNREITLFGRYQHVAFDSTDVSRNYNSDEVRFGIRVRQ